MGKQYGFYGPRLEKVWETLHYTVVNINEIILAFLVIFGFGFGFGSGQFSVPVQNSRSGRSLIIGSILT